MDYDQIKRELEEFLHPSYPDLKVRIENWIRDPSKMAVYFIETQFAVLYPLQRYHYITHHIPAQYQEEKLADSVWFELAPGENPDDLRYPDESLVEEIKPLVMKCIIKTHFVEALDNALCPSDSSKPRSLCYGDYRNSKSILLSQGFKEDEFFDIFHVFMNQGGYCDCEILYNVAEDNRLKSQYWIARAENRKPYDPHRGK